ncbi:putative Protein TEX261 [Hypsibius exemplaris]|uniref:Protein TEX261 n=1 Tax=Hypsibius exemplaris TaxID=2072580 RepID=A0A1W0XD04_HYPEX|nr:putative Protein TEX261 [Hypsibius exemplaris]
MLLWCLTWVSALILLLAVSFALAVSLYFLAELVEENSKTSCKVIRGMIVISATLYTLLVPFEPSFPWTIIVAGLSAQMCHFMLMQTFPAIELKSVWFVGTIALFVLNHYLTFRHFSEVFYPFNEILAFFVLYLWMVPMSLLVSLSANDNVLPTYSNSNNSLGRNHDSNFLTPATQFAQKRKGGYSLKGFLVHIKEKYLPLIGVGEKKGF